MQLLRHELRWMAFAVVLGLCYAPAQAQFDDVEIKMTPVAGNIHMIEGAGGKLAICAGEDGILLVDDQFAPLTEKIVEAIASLNQGPVRFLLNTHWHFDHTGGNENFGNAGAILVSHENVRGRLNSKQFIEFVQRASEPQPKAALPILTFNDEMNFHLNGEDILVLHLARSHTDGDAIVFFRNANVIHAGDIFWGGMYPFIDLSSGGSVDGMIESTRKILALADDKTRIIPGHGSAGGRPELQAFHDMLQEIRGAVAQAIEAGADLQATIARKPSAAFDADWGQGWIQPDQIVQFVYDSLTQE